MAQIPMEIAPSRGVIIERVVRVAEATHARYVTPPQAVIVGAPGVVAQDSVMTAVCWLVGKRPGILQEYRPEFTPEMAEDVRRAVASPKADQLMVFAGMGGLMTLAKEIFRGTRSNEEYLKLHWKALCATANIANMWEGPDAQSPDVFRHIVSNLMEWQAWIKPHGEIRRLLLEYCMENTEDNPLIRGALEQVKMILKDYGLRAALLMESFIMAGSRAIFISSIAQQAVTLKAALKELREKHGEKFPYLRVYPLEGSERLNHRSYPDLYYAAVKYARQQRTWTRRSIYHDHCANHSIQDSNRFSSKQRYRVVTTIDEATKANLITLGIDVEASKRPRAYDDDEERYYVSW